MPFKDNPGFLLLVSCNVYLAAPMSRAAGSLCCSQAQRTSIVRSTSSVQYTCRNGSTEFTLLQRFANSTAKCWEHLAASAPYSTQ